MHRRSFNPRVRAGRDAVFDTFNNLSRVSIHASARDATKPPAARVPSEMFQSTRPRGTRPVPVLRQDLVGEFQSTRPRGTRPDLPATIAGPPSFNPRVRAGRDTECMCQCNSGGQFQSTRPRGTRHHAVGDEAVLEVSIHASARDATRLRRRPQRSACFNPRVRAGRDAAIPECHAAISCFNPRVRAGRDRSQFRKFDCRLFQSTRPRGTRRLRSRSPPVEPCFNPRVRAGRDWYTGSVVAVRHGFNPRVRAGRDMVYACISVQGSAVSIHASARDATLTATPTSSGASCFNPRVRAGRD